MKLIALAILLSLGGAGPLVADEPIPRFDDPLAKRMEGSWKSSFKSTAGGALRVYLLYRVHRGGHWTESVYDDATKKVITSKSGTYITPPEHGAALAAEKVRFLQPGQRDVIEDVRCLPVELLKLGPEHRVIIYKRIPDAEVPLEARLK